MLGRYGVRYVVLEPNFWNDLQSMQMLVRMVRRMTLSYWHPFP